MILSQNIDETERIKYKWLLYENEEITFGDTDTYNDLFQDDTKLSIEDENE